MRGPRQGRRRGVEGAQKKANKENNRMGDQISMQKNGPTRKARKSDQKKDLNRREKMFANKVMCWGVGLGCVSQGRRSRARKKKGLVSYV